jgi:hypothetical protein
VNVKQGFVPLAFITATPPVAPFGPPPVVPGISLVKTERVGTVGGFTRGPVTGKIGDIVFYELLATNTGVTILDVTLSDPGCDPGTVSPSGGVTIAPGHVAFFACSHVLTAGDAPVFVNTATVHAQSISAKARTVAATSKATANVAGVLGARKTLEPAKVTKPAHAAAPAVAPAHFTGHAALRGARGGRTGSFAGRPAGGERRGAGALRGDPHLPRARGEAALRHVPEPEPGR